MKKYILALLMILSPACFADGAVIVSAPKPETVTLTFVGSSWLEIGSQLRDLITKETGDPKQVLYGLFINQEFTCLELKPELAKSCMFRFYGLNFEGIASATQEKDSAQPKVTLISLNRSLK